MRQDWRGRSLCLFLLLQVWGGVVLQAQSFQYQGVLSDAEGNPVTGTREVTFWLYDGEASSKSLWKETHAGVAVESGHFAVDLGLSVSLVDNVDFSRDLYLEIAVDGEILNPRCMLRHVPKAIHADTATSVKQVEGVPVGKLSPSSGRFTTLATTGNVTLGDTGSDTVTVYGKLRVASGSPEAGKVLVSDAFGNATWATMTVPGQPVQVLRVGTGAEYGTIQAAQNAILDNSATRPYLIQLAPGRYEEQVFLKPYVSLVGVGRENTVIAMPAGSSESRTVIVLAPADGGDGNRVIRDLTVEHTIASGTFAIALFAENCPVLRLRNLGLTAVGGATCSYGLQVWTSAVDVADTRIDVRGTSDNRGISLENAELNGDRLDVQIHGAGRSRSVANDGLHLYRSELRLTDSNVEAQEGVASRGIVCAEGAAGGEQEVLVKSCHIAAITAAWEQSNATGDSVRSLVLDSLVEGPINATVGGFQCFGSVDSDGNRLRTVNASVPVVRQKEDNLEAVLTVGAGGEYATIADAMAAIADNSATRPYVIKVGPGVFAERVAMKPHVSLVGSGVKATRIEPLISTSGVNAVAMADSSLLSDLTVAADFGAFSGSLVGHMQVGGVTLERLRLELTGTGTATGIYLFESQVVCHRVELLNGSTNTNANAVYLYSGSEASPDSLTATDCSFTGPIAVNLNMGVCVGRLTGTDLHGTLKSNGNLSMRQCESDGHVMVLNGGQLLAESCGFANCALMNGRSNEPSDAPRIELRQCRFAGSIANYSSATLLIAMSQLTLSSAIVNNYVSTTTLFQCYDESFAPVAGR